MRDPAVQANQNLVVNGDFSHAIDHWNKHPSNTREVSLAEEFYQGQMTRFLRVGNGASVSQVIAVPMAARTDVWYGLSFLCEVRYSGTGRVLIEMVDHPENNQDIPLLLGQARNEEEDRARLLSGQPLEFLPIEYEVRLTLPLQSNDRIRVRVFSPTGGTGDVMTCITRIHLALHLPRMELQTLKLDEELLPAAGVLPLCLGASASSRHRLECVPMPGHPWLGTQAALTLENNPRGAILAQPDWGVDHPLEAPWSLDCPLLDDPGPRLLTMQLVNQYTAEPYPIEVSLGHHRLVFRDVLEAAYYPVMEHGQTALLGVQVASFYTGQTLDALTVNWTVAGQGVRGASLTDEDGWAYFKYVPTTAGDFAIEATVASLYYASGIVSTTLAVRVLATDPWKTLLSVVEGIEKRWEDTNGYPNRGSGYPLQVRLPADHLLSGSEMQLRWSGDSAEQLGVVVSPALESPVPVNGRDLTWTLTSEDRLDGRFELSLVCSKLLLPSPKKPCRWHAIWSVLARYARPTSFRWWTKTKTCCCGFRSCMCWSAAMATLSSMRWLTGSPPRARCRLSSPGPVVGPVCCIRRKVPGIGLSPPVSGRTKRLWRLNVTLMSEPWPPVRGRVRSGSCSTTSRSIVWCWVCFAGVAALTR